MEHGLGVEMNDSEHECLSGCPRPSVFSEVVITDWYDGELAGGMRCSECSNEYRFEFLAWDEDHSQRLFVCSQLPRGSIDQLVRAFSAAGRPSWPAWWPGRFPNDEERERASSEADSILNQSGETTHLVQSKAISEALDRCWKVVAESQRQRIRALRDLTTELSDWRELLSSLQELNRPGFAGGSSS
jgi:hypothetical protein